MKKYITIFLVLLFSSMVTPKKKFQKTFAIPTTQEIWVDSMYNSFTLEEKIGQLFMVAAYSNKNEAHAQSIEKLIDDNKIGGLIFFQGGPVRQAELTNRFQKKSKTPLFIGIDAEWGLNMRLDSTYRYPWNMTLGAIKNTQLIENLGEQMGEQSNRMGIHFNFAPVVDINTNPKNPIIGNRSFGENKYNVAQAAVALTKGLQSKNVFATAKHFPGHGDTSVDSHETLPLVNFTKQRLDSVELYPYRELIKNDIASIMIAHLNVPSIESRKGYPTSISYNVVTNILKHELGFNGLIFTDALNMKGASNFKQPGDIDYEAFMAGNDVLLFPENVPLAVEKFKAAYQNGQLSEIRLAQSVKKILVYKYKAGLNNYMPIILDNLVSDLNQPKYDALNYKLYENAITTLKNSNEIIPFKNLEKEKIAYISLGDDDSFSFFESLNQYARVTEIKLDNLNSALEVLESYTKVIIGFHKADGAWKNHDLSFTDIMWIDKIARQNKVVLCLFSKPYSLSKLGSLKNTESVVLSYQNNNFAHKATAAILFGASESVGRLPVSIEDKFECNDGLATKTLKRLGFSYPENEGMNSKKLNKIDSLVKYAIQKEMTPGAQVLVARNGKIIYNKAFGHHTYDTLSKVKTTDSYDVASLTKILATLPNVMVEFDKKKIAFNNRLGQILPVFKGTDKENLTVLDMLTHQARLYPWIPFYKETLDSITKQPSEKFYRKSFSEAFPTQVSEHLYLIKGYNDTIIKRVIQSELLPSKSYKYSDLAFIIMKEYLELENQKTLDKLVAEIFYDKLGATTITYNPLQKIDSDLIIPTEIDNYYRYGKVQGYVHDMGAAMQGGVGGHAGLFSNSLDVAKMMQMYLQKGFYGGDIFFSEATFNAFNACYYCKDNNRRGVGFDKPQLGNSGPTCGCVSMTSFGHTGFTGTLAWADPEKQIVYVFLSNRTYPEAKTNSLSRANIREKIQQVIYDSIIE